jgi:hypothetical protein
MNLNFKEGDKKLPVPKKGEKKSDFIERYMGSSEAQRSFPNAKQRVAVANSVYKEKKK